MSEERISILLVDDHSMVREGLRMLLEAKPGLRVVAEASDGEEALELVHQHHPKIVLMDVTMPKMNGIEATRSIMGLNLDTRVLGLTVHESREYFFRMLEAGASGYLLKGATSKELVEAIWLVHGGGVYLTPSLVGWLVEEHLRARRHTSVNAPGELTTREEEVLRRIAEGLTNQQVADALHLSIYTVQTHRAHIMQKLGLESRHQLINYAISKGYLKRE
ncbi:MAG: response regulator transcription factor [Chloroflexi bacterium]|nr:response regulator transcription factor [Chloroflexota bacterium]